MEGNSVMRPIDSLLIASRVTQSPPILRRAHPGSRAPTLTDSNFVFDTDAADALVAAGHYGAIPSLRYAGHSILGQESSCHQGNYASTFPRASRLPRQRHPLGFGQCCNGCKRNGEILRLSSRMLQLGA